ncbi:hypothetical protein FJZ40_01490 [Candidatus Shapirobacteria bacterium]|nr:hypothetical protein [Candidatus Shapirobacteria bacterium]
MKIAIPSNEALPRLHEIQWQILKRMSFRPESRFNEIKPKVMDPKRFTYHLNRLKNLDLVRHDFRRGVYLLTDKAKLLTAYFTDIPSWGNLPLNSGILLYIEKSNKVLVVKRDHQPFLGYVGLPYFLTQNNEFVYQSAMEGLRALGLTGKLSLPLIIEVLFKNNRGEFIRHAFMLTYYCRNPKGEVSKRSYEGELSWIEPSALLKIKLGYDNSKDVVDFFSKKQARSGVTIISKVYHTPM